MSFSSVELWQIMHLLLLAIIQLKKNSNRPEQLLNLATPNISVRVHLQLHPPTARTEYFMNGTFHFLYMYAFFCSACSVFFLLFYDLCFCIQYFATVSFRIEDFEIFSCVCVLPTTTLVLRLL